MDSADAEHPIPAAVTGSAVESPPHETDSPELQPNSSSPRDEVRSPPDSPSAAGSRVRSPPTSSENHMDTPQETKAMVVTGSRPPENENSSSPKEIKAIVPRVSSLRDGAVTGSPVRSPHREANEVPVRFLLREAEQQTARAELRYEKQSSFGSVSSYRSLVHDAENPAASPQHKELVLGSSVIGAMTVGSILRTPLGNVAPGDPALEKVTSPMVPVINRMVARETASPAKAGGRGVEWRGPTGVEPGTSWTQGMIKATVVLRVLALILSLISFSVMAADKTSGWDGDSFDRYIEFRYCLSVNVLVFVYSLFQLYVQIHHKIKKRRLMSRPVNYSFDFFMDQILAYLLMSASSSAASRNGDWVSDFGSDKFTKMIDGSIAMSFLAFFALGVSSIISAYKFFSWSS